MVDKELNTNVSQKDTQEIPRSGYGICSITEHDNILSPTHTNAKNCKAKIVIGKKLYHIILKLDSSLAALFTITFSSRVQYSNIACEKMSAECDKNKFFRKKTADNGHLD